ncbi:MAG: hypothetical protein ACREJG_06350 [Candidatus Rokuibacteriota bacterium]
MKLLVASIVVSSIMVALGPAASQSRFDIYDRQGKRTAYGHVDQRSGRLDLHDARTSERLGHGRIDASGRIDFFDHRGRRLDRDFIERAQDRRRK